MATPTDPLFSQQWHFDLIGNIQTIWDEYTGHGIKVGVYDDGVQRTHQDLVGNYDASLHTRNGNLVLTANPDIFADEAHGTAAAGVIAAAANSSGGVGVAYNSTLAGISIFGGQTYSDINATNPTGFLNVVRQATVLYDIMSNSWGTFPLYDSNQNLSDSFSFADRLESEYAHISANGRNGLGTIIVQAAGNEFADANGDGINASMHTITVAATDQTGEVADYSNYGASILVSAPAAEVTTDLIGSRGYNKAGSAETPFPDPLSDLNYTSVFGGTSAATPIVSGIVALMLEANPSLGWRDVQNILALSATHTGSDIGSAPSTFEFDTWNINGANNWNGGGMHFNGSYGYGMVDAFQAVRMAEAWEHLFTAPQTSGNLQSASFTADTEALNFIPDDDPDGVTFSVNSSSNISVEHIKLVLDINHSYIGDISIFLTSPDNVKLQVAWSDPFISTFHLGEWTYGIESFRGQSANGTWTVQIIDNGEGDTGVLNGASLEFLGSASSNNDVYHYTSDYELMLAQAPSRAVLMDQSGTDTGNFSAIAQSLKVVMASNGSGAFYDLDATSPTTAIGTIANGTIIENAVMGDGDDEVTGNQASNELHGMRGDDRLLGEGGADQLHGGAGNDFLNGGIGNDTLNGGTGNDFIWGGSGADNMTGGAGNDIYYAPDIGDVATELANEGLDTVYSTRTFTLGANVEVLRIYDNAAVNGTGNASDNSLNGNLQNNVLTGLAGNDFLNGSIGNDTLFGGTGEDTLWGGMNGDNMIGGAGKDIYYVDNGGDLVTEDFDNGTIDWVYSTISYTLGNNLEYLLLWGPDDINGTGNALNNSMVGTNGNNILTGLDGNDILNGSLGDDQLLGGLGRDLLWGGLGADTMTGGAGDDIYYIDNVSDVAIEQAGDGSIDTVFASVSYAMATGIENLNLYGSAAINADGNASNNAIIGNAANNIIGGGAGDDNINGASGNDLLRGNDGNDTLFGGAGFDYMSGGTGDDIYYIDHVSDTVYEVSGAGQDKAFSSVSYTAGYDLEELVLTGSSNLNATGSNTNNKVVGNSGANTISGGLGNDTLIGGGDADRFLFDTTLSTSNVDVIEDFTQGTDRIVLDRAIFTGVSSFNVGGFPSLATTQFSDDFQAGLTVLTRILFEQTTGNLYFDPDGLFSAPAQHFATVNLAPGVVLEASDFEVI